MTDLLNEAVMRLETARDAWQRGAHTKCIKELGTVAALVKRAMHWCVETQC